MPVRCCALLVALVCAACGSSGGNSSVGNELNVFAAASLAHAFGQIEQDFEAMRPGVDVRLNVAGSSALREQIVSGAPADVFASANMAVMDELTNEGEVEAPVPFARNSMQIGVPAGNPAAVTSIDDFTNTDLFLGACIEGVPCGDAALDVFAAASIEAALDTTEPDVGALVTKLAAGELDAGIVYRSDVVSSGEIDGIELPTDSNVVVVYPIAQLQDARDSSLAVDFIAFVLSGEGQSILAEAGFASIDGAS